MTQTCARCAATKPLADFAWRSKAKNLLDAYCRPCRAAYHREHYARHRTRYIRNARERKERVHRTRTEWLIEYLSEHPCVDCGEKDPVVLEFDHVDGIKEFDVGAGFRGYQSWERVIREIEKCEVVCANCHRRRTSRRGGFLKGVLLAERAGRPGGGAGEENRTPVI